MSKHLRAMTKDGTTFGMDVDGIHAMRIMRKAERLTKKITFGTIEHVIHRNGLRSNLIAGLMGHATWLVTENRDFEWVQFDDSMRYYVIYPEEVQP